MLRELADKYETSEFIKNDPIQIPHRYTDKRDIEISALVTSWISWGNRTSIIRTADYIDREIFQCKPYKFITDYRNFEKFKGDKRKIYRTYAYSDFYDLCHILYGIYSMSETLFYYMDDTYGFDFIMIGFTNEFGHIKGFPNNLDSACKRLNMFLRWMCRKNSTVDFGIWDYDQKELIIPLDTHVMRAARTLGIIKTFTPSLKAAWNITQAMKEVFPQDPCRGDFALFGYGKDVLKKEKR